MLWPGISAEKPCGELESPMGHTDELCQVAMDDPYSMLCDDGLDDCAFDFDTLEIQEQLQAAFEEGNSITPTAPPAKDEQNMPAATDLVQDSAHTAAEALQDSTDQVQHSAHTTAKASLDHHQEPPDNKSNYKRPAARLREHLEKAHAGALELKAREAREASHPPKEPQVCDSAIDGKTKETVETHTTEKADPQQAVQACPLRDKARSQQAKSASTKDFSNFKEMYAALVTPRDWKTTEYVSADQQKPPQKRGRKPKAPTEETKKASRKRSKVPEGSDDETAPPAKTRARAKSSAAKTTKKHASPKPKRDASAMPKSTAKRRKKNAHNDTTVSASDNPTADPALEMIPVPKADRTKAKPLPNVETDKPTTYEAPEVDDECNDYDAYAAADASSSVARLGQGDNDSAISSPNNAEATNAEASGTKPSNTETNNTDASLEVKKMRSRKCCAYKKARNLALKEGKTKEEAAEAGQKVASLVI